MRDLLALVRLLVADVSDATCGFKIFRGDVGRDIFSRLRTYGWSFDAELLLVAKLRGYSHAELPVQWTDRAGSSVRLGRDVIRTLIGLFRIRWNSARGLYVHTHELDPARRSWTNSTQSGGT